MYSPVAIAQTALENLAGGLATGVLAFNDYTVPLSGPRSAV